MTYNAAVMLRGQRLAAQVEQRLARVVLSSLVLCFCGSARDVT